MLRAIREAGDALWKLLMAADAERRIEFTLNRRTVRSAVERTTR